jgi:hypothetical protein
MLSLGLARKDSLRLDSNTLAATILMVNTHASWKFQTMEANQRLIVYKISTFFP